MNIMDKNASHTIKAVAIILMVVHHFWGSSSSWIIFNYWSVFNKFGLPVEPLIGAFAKICVGLFAFISGYAFYKHKSKYVNFTYRLRKGLEFLINYWIVYFIIVAIGAAMGEPLPSFSKIIQNMFGFSSKVYDYGTGYINSNFAWYVYFYLSLLMLMPIITKSIERSFLVNVIQMLCLFSVMSRVISPLVAGIPYISSLVNDFIEYCPVVLIGFYAAQFQIIEVFISYTRTLDNLSKAFINIMLFGICFVIKIKYLRIFGISVDVFCAFIFILIIEQSRIWIQSKNKNGVDILEKIIDNVSKESTNIWYLHAVFFTPFRTLQRVALLPQISILIIVWVFVILIPVSVALRHLQNFVVKIVFSN